VSPTTRRIPWARFLGEAVLIIGSVYVAIVLEGMSQERSETRDARDAVGQLLLELREDRADLAVIRAEQERLDSVYTDLLRWISASGSIAGDSVGQSLFELGWSNRTMFPRLSAWRTMIAEGQLSALDAPDLVKRMGNFYENVTRRLEYNGREYDHAIDRLANQRATEYWNPQTLRPFDERPEVTARFRSDLRQVHIAWNVFYLDLLDEYEVLLTGLIDDIEVYLASHGLEANEDE